MRVGIRVGAVLVVVALGAGCSGPTDQASQGAPSPPESTVSVTPTLAGSPSRPPAAPSASPSSGASQDAPTPSPAATASTLPVTPAPTGTTRPLVVVTDPELDRWLPSSFTDLTFVHHSLAAGDRVPEPLDGGVLESIRDQAAGPAARVSLAWIDTAPGAADQALRLRVLALRVRGATGIRLRSAYLETTLRNPGSYQVWTGSQQGGPRAILPDDRFAFLRDDTLFVVGTSDPTLSGATAASTWTRVQAFVATLPVSQIAPLSLLPVVSPAPSSTIDPNALPHADPALEAMLPATAGGVHLEAISLPVRDALLNMALGLGPAVLALGGQPLDLDRVTVALAHAQALSSFVVIAVRVPGASRRTLMGRMLGGSFLAGTSGTSDSVEVVDVDGRRLILGREATQGYVAADGVAYLMLYFDMGDTFGASMPPRPAFRDLAEDAVRSLPAGVDAGF